MHKLTVWILGMIVVVAIAAGARAGGAADEPPGKPAVSPANQNRDDPKAQNQPAPAPRVKVVAGPVEVERAYRLSLGPWTWQFSAPESIDLPDIADRIRGFFGMFLILGVAAFLSENRQAISRRVVFWGLGLQWGFALLVLRVPAGVRLLEHAGEGVKAVLDCAIEGASFVFGAPLVNPSGPAGFVFAFAVLYHLGVMQWIVRAFAVVMARLMGTSGAESLNVAASLFLGQTEAPLTIRPYLARLTRSELLTVMTSGMAHVSGGVMAAYIAFDIEARHILTAVIMTPRRWAA
jgi:CNT family concentrative nucleoside transporter